jgi:hypothetical protein
MKWIPISRKYFDKLWLGVLYKAYAGGRLHEGGTYTEYTPHSALNPKSPDLRVERHTNGELTHYVLIEHDSRD